MKKITYLFLLTAALGACTPKPSNKVETIQPAEFVSIFPKGEMPLKVLILTVRHISNG